MDVQDLKKNSAEQKLYYEYVDTYKQILKYIKKVNKEIVDLKFYYKSLDKKNKDNKPEIENYKIKINNKTKERNILYSTESSLLDIVMYLERYLPYESRFYSRKYTDEQRKLTFNKASNVGFILKEKLNENDVESLVHNKLLQNEMLVILKELLTSRQYTCMYMYFYEGFTQEQIADKLGITHQNVSVHISNSIDIIRKSENLLNLIEYLGSD